MKQGIDIYEVVKLQKVAVNMSTNLLHLVNLGELSISEKLSPKKFTLYKT